MSEQQENQAAELEALGNAAAVDEAETVSGEWQPGEDMGAEPEPPGPSTADVLGPMLQITFGLLAAKRGAHWALSDEEATEAGRAYGDVLDKYFPDVAVGCEVTAVMVTLAIVGPRAMEDKRQSAMRDAAERASAEAEEERAGGMDGDQSER